MSANAVDLWGDFGLREIRTPVVILREQAAVLNRKTSGFIQGRVATHAGDGSFRHALSLVVPILDDYSYQLLHIEHGVDIYPLRAYSGEERADLESEEAFVAWLAVTLASPKTRGIIANLVALAKS